MIPRTYPSTDASNGQSQLIGYYLGSIEGLTRWVDYIPVRFNSYLNGPENTYDLNGYIPVSSISSITGLTPFKDYVPLYIDNTSTDVWTSDVDGYIPIGLKKSNGASLELDFTKTTTLDSRITFTRASTATYFDSTGVMQTAAINAPRFDFDPASKEPKGLLIEEQRTNLLTYSEQFDNAAWTKTRSTITANTIIAPDGALTGDTFADTVDNNTHTLRTATITSAPTTSAVTATIYVKQNDQSNLFILYVSGDLDTSTYGRVASTFNLSTGTVAGNASANGATFTSNSITPVGNGWYRCSVTGTVGSTGSPTGVRFVAGFATVSNASVASSYAGTGQSVYIWGAQLEAGAFATSYIPTVASQVTRAADAASMTGTNFSSWYNQTEGTFFAQFTPAVSNFGINRNIFMASDGTTVNSVGVRYGSSGSQPSLTVITSSTNQAILVTGAMIAGTSYKLAGAYKANDFAASRDARTVVTDTSGTVPVVTQAEIGMLAGTAFSTQTISKLAYYPTRLSNTELKAITA